MLRRKAELIQLYFEAMQTLHTFNEIVIFSCTIEALVKKSGYYQILKLRIK